MPTVYQFCKQLPVGIGFTFYRHIRVVYLKESAIPRPIKQITAFWEENAAATFTPYPVYQFLDRLQDVFSSIRADAILRYIETIMDTLLHHSLAV